MNIKAVSVIQTSSTALAAASRLSLFCYADVSQIAVARAGKRLTQRISGAKRGARDLAQAASEYRDGIDRTAGYISQNQRAHAEHEFVAAAALAFGGDPL